VYVVYIKVYRNPTDCVNTIYVHYIKFNLHDLRKLNIQTLSYTQFT